MISAILKLCLALIHCSKRVHDLKLTNYDTRHILGLCVLIANLFVSTTAYAVQPDEMLDDPLLEARAQEIGKEVRCLVCRNESVEDSNADLARDLRLVIRERLSAGDSDPEVLSFLVDRYGEYVLLRPRFGGSTLWLWLAGPALLLLGAGIALAFVLKGRRDVAALTDDEEARLRGLLEDDG